MQPQPKIKDFRPGTPIYPVPYCPDAFLFQVHTVLAGHGKPHLQKKAMVGIIRCKAVCAKCTPTRDKLHKRGVKPRMQRDKL